MNPDSQFSELVPYLSKSALSKSMAGGSDGNQTLSLIRSWSPKDVSIAGVSVDGARARIKLRALSSQTRSSDVVRPAEALQESRTGICHMVLEDGRNWKVDREHWNVAVGARKKAPDQKWCWEAATTAYPRKFASGKLVNREFSLEKATFDTDTIELRQGKGFFAELSVKVFLGTNGVKEATTIKVDEFSGSEGPQITVHWKDPKDMVPQSATFLPSDGYGLALKLEKK